MSIFELIIRLAGLIACIFVIVELSRSLWEDLKALWRLLK